MISFSRQIKNEILVEDVSVFCCSQSELAAYIFLIGKKKDNSIEFTVDTEEFAERICSLIFKVFKMNVSYLKLSNGFSIMLNCGSKFEEKYGFIFKNELKISVLADTYKKNCCRASFIKGVFLSCGSLVDPRKNYNLEFSFKNSVIAEKILYLLENIGFEFKTVIRKSNYVLYVKKSDVICDILTFIGAYNAQMQILNLKIEREVRNDFNRASNIETANIDKTVKASIKHITAIEKISRKKGLDYLPQELYEVATLRLIHRDLSLGELSGKLSKPITKSGINHRLNKIMKIADEI